MSLGLLFHYLMLNMFRMLIYPSSGACDLFFELFHGLYCSGGLMCVGVTLWFDWGGVVSVCRLEQELATYLPSYFMVCIALVRCVFVLRCGLAHIEPEQYNP